jgi:KUP system potassium uptake protein
VGKHINKVSAAGLIIALGIIYGDIGTSPCMCFDAIINSKPIDDLLIIGSLSCIIWTLTLQTTIKYVLLTLKADNRGEGGFSYIPWYVARKNGWYYQQ